MFDFQSIVLLITILFNLFLAWLVLSQNVRDKTNLFFGAFVLSIILWTLSMLMFRITNEYANAMLWLRLSYVAAGFIGITFFGFCIFFTKSRLSNIFWLLLIFIVGLMTALLLQPWFLIHSIVFSPSGKLAIEEPLHHLAFSLYFIFFFFGALAIIGNKYTKERGLERSRLGYIFWGVFLAGFLGTLFNLVLPSPWFNEWRLTWLGPVFTLIFVYFIALAITKYHLFDIKVIATELFTALLLLLLFINIFSYSTFGQLVLNLTIFVGALIFGIFLIRSVLQEVRTREEMEKLALALERANVELKRLDKARTEFMSMASHQLRTPLTAIKGYISLALEGQYGKFSEKMKKSLKNVYLSNERLVNLVDDLLTISRIEMGKLTAEKEPTKIEDLIKSCIEEMKIAAQKKKLKMFFEKPKALLPKINIDPLKIRQVILNLIDNAIKYTQTGYVSIAANSKQGKIIIQVKDTGEGFTQEEKETFFEGFTRGRAGTAFYIEGAGLGLYVAKKYLDLHQGKIYAESKGRGKGSTFYVELLVK